MAPTPSCKDRFCERGHALLFIQIKTWGGKGGGGRVELMDIRDRRAKNVLNKRGKTEIREKARERERKRETEKGNKVIYSKKK